MEQTDVDLVLLSLNGIHFSPWPWYVTGPLIGLLVPLMLILGSSFGVSGNLETICSLVGAGKVSDYFKLDLKRRMPSLLFVIGAIVGGFIAANWLSIENYYIALSSDAINSIQSLGVFDTTGYSLLSFSTGSFSSVLMGYCCFVLADS